MKKIMRCLAILIISGLITGCYYGDARELIKEITNINIPNNSSLVYRYEGSAFIPRPGQRAQYYVFSFEETPTQFLIDNQFKNDVDFKEDYIFEFDVFEKMYEHQIPQEYLVNWENENLYLEMELSYFVFSVEISSLSVFIIET